MGQPYAPPHVTHLFTVDVEDYFQVGAFERLIPRGSWETRECRVERNVDLLLEMLDAAGATGTFFTLGWIAERYPALIRRMARAGHEIASHGVSHRRINEITIAEFREEARTSRAVLEDVSGTHVIGFRAPNFSILPGCEWAFDVLVEEGYEYDSSRFPINRPGYGSPRAPRYAHTLDTASGTLVEVPLTTLDVLGMRVPAAGGAYLRHFPYTVIREAFRDCERSGIPGVFFIHPWELDPGQPRIDAPWLSRVRHYRNLDRTAIRLERLLKEFRFEAVAGSLPVMTQNAPLMLA
jgi:polysaccharide deacetylase family protein (PEP-CTERM system associated)